VRNLFVTSLVSVFEATMRVISMYMITSWLKKEKKEKMWKSKECLH